MPRPPSRVKGPTPIGMANTDRYQSPPAKPAEPQGQPNPGPTEEQRVRHQVSGVSRAAAESSAPVEAEASSSKSASTAESETVVVTPTSAGTSSSEPAQEEFGFEGQP